MGFTFTLTGENLENLLRFPDLGRTVKMGQKFWLPPAAETYPRSAGGVSFSQCMES